MLLVPLSLLCNLKVNHDVLLLLLLRNLEGTLGREVLFAGILILMLDSGMWILE